MRILFFGDVVGRDARDAIVAQLPGLRARWKLDAVIVNVENAAHGFGVTAQICKDLYAAGADCLTTGNHVWDQREIIPHIDRDPRLLRPLNFPPGTPGRGACVVETPGGEKLLVANIMARLFMPQLIDDPFAAADVLLAEYRIRHNVNAVLIDFHGEATSEKMAFGHYCDGRASVVVGTHTHVPTADAQVLPGGTGYMSDAGMCGAYDSVLGMEKTAAVTKFMRQIPGERLSPAGGAVTLCGLYAEIDSKTGLCTALEPVRIGGRLSQAMPAA